MSSGAERIDTVRLEQAGNGTDHMAVLYDDGDVAILDDENDGVVLEEHQQERLARALKSWNGVEA